MTQDKEDKESEKHPLEMTTSEALDYVFGEELATKLKEESALINCQPKPDDSNSNDN